MRMRLTRTLVAGAAGAAGAYFLDPERGRTRRAKLTGQLGHATRRFRHRAGARGRYAVGRVEGVAARAVGKGRPEPTSDQELTDLVKAAIARADVPDRQVVVDCASGVVTLRGQVHLAAHGDELRAAVAAIPGVREVRSYLHLAGEPAPNKEPAIQASHRS